MGKPSKPSATPSQLSAKLNQQLNMYALAASAAGVSLLAVAQPSEAKVVYTKTHQVVGANGVYGLDLNHDGVVDFLIQEWTTFALYPLLAKGALGNAVQGAVSSASALIRGAWIGPSQHFVKSGYSGENMAWVGYNTETGSRFVGGAWVNVTNRYLGLQFKINGETHYGWARLSVHVQGKTITAILTGYAFETIPRRRLRAGQVETDDLSDHQKSIAAVAPSPNETSQAAQPARLGTLALGAQGLALWRRP